MKHAVLGAGAIGGLVATVLAHEGEQVTILVRPHKYAHQSGMFQLTRPHENMVVEVGIAAKLTEPVDVLWVAVTPRICRHECVEAADRAGPVLTMPYGVGPISGA